MAIKLNTETLRYIAALGKSSGAEIKDCVVSENAITYVVRKGHLGMAIGKNGVNVKRISTGLGKRIKIVEFSENPVEFVESLLGSVENKKIRLEEKEGGKTIFVETDYKTKGAIVGKGGKNIELIKNLLKRHHNIDNVIVE